VLPLDWIFAYGLSRDHKLKILLYFIIMSIRLQSCTSTHFDLTAMNVDSDYVTRIVEEDDSDVESVSSSNDEDELVKNMVRDAFSGRISNNDLKRFLQEDDDNNSIEMRCNKRARTSSIATTPERNLVKAVSCDRIQEYSDEDEDNDDDIDYSCVSPEKHLQTILEACDDEFRSYSASTLSYFFVNLNEESTDGYDMEYMSAVHANDVLKLRHMMESGHNMQCSNRFGETILHFICRRGLFVPLNFLVHDAKVNVRVKCDNGRTPLHEACWTAKPNWNIINLLLDHCPDLLYITDNRGHSPLAYVPKEVWGDWCKFLNSRDVEELKRREI
jgi:Ankyrin repeats (3 copies)